VLTYSNYNLIKITSSYNSTQSNEILTVIKENTYLRSNAFFKG